MQSQLIELQSTGQTQTIVPQAPIPQAPYGAVDDAHYIQIQNVSIFVSFWNCCVAIVSLQLFHISLQSDSQNEQVQPDEQNEGTADVTLGEILNVMDAKITANTESMKAIVVSLSDLHAKMDLMLQNTQMQASNSNTSASAAAAAPKPVTFKRIITFQDAAKFDADLSLNIEYGEQLAKEFMLKHGTDIGPYGSTRVAPALRQEMFSNQLFKVCSWSGADATGEKKLYEFGDMDHLIEFFWRIVNNADKTFLLDDAKTHFQNVMNRKKSLKDDDQIKIKPHSKKRPLLGSYKKSKRAKNAEGDAENSKEDAENSAEPAIEIDNEHHNAANDDNAANDEKTTPVSNE